MAGARLNLPRLRPEAELLLACARLSVQPPVRERIVQLLGGTLDWSYLVALAERHGLRPLLYRSIDAQAPDAVPAPVLALLWAWTERMRSRNRAMAKELLRILEIFDANAIPALPYKGPALAASIYGDLSLREFGDLDVLLRREDIQAAVALLAQQGFEPEYALRPRDQAALVRSGVHYHLAFVHPASSIMVELHWKTDVDFPVEVASHERWWARPPTLALEGGRVRAFDATQLLLILCLHGSKHHWLSLGWLVDVAELIGQDPGLDWEWVLEQTQVYGCVRRLAVGLDLAHALLDAPVPSWVLQRIAVLPGIQAVQAKILGGLFDPQPLGMSRLETLRLDLALYDSPRSRLRHLLRVIFAPSIEEWAQWRQARALRFLIYPKRLIRLVCKWAMAKRGT